MTDLRMFFKQSSHYLIGQVLIIMAGFASFPILTRVLSVSEYGILNLVMSTTAILLAFSKLGLNHSSIRYYQEIASGSRKESISHFYNTLIIATAAFTIVIITLFWTLFRTILAGVFDKRFSDLLIFVVLLTLLRSLHLILRGFLRAEHRTLTWNAVAIGQRYGTLMVGFLCFFYVSRNLTGYYLGQTIAEVFVLAYLLYDLSRKVEIHWNHFSRDLLQASIRYGIPMLGVEVLGILTSYSDRYLIEYFRGAYDLGMYSVGSNMVNYVGLVFTVPVQLGLMPICMNVWVNKGRQQTEEFLGETFRYFCLVAIPVTLAFIATSEDLTVLIASEKYASSASVVPYLMIGSLLLAATNIVCAPILLHERTAQLGLLFLVAYLENLALNFLMIPRMGILGAAYVRLIVYLTLFLFVAISSLKHLRIRVPLRSVLLYSIASYIMYLVVASIDNVRPPVVSILLKLGLGSVVYGLIVGSLDKTVRANARTFFGGVVRSVSDRVRK